MKVSIRLRLSLFHTLLFFLTAVLLVAGIYVLTERSTTATSTDPRSRVEQALGLPPGTLFDRRGTLEGREHLPGIPPPRSTLRAVASGVQTETRSQLLFHLVLFSAGLLLLMTIASFVIGWIVSGRALRPLRRITERARSLSASDLHEPIALQGPRDELRELADTFDEMLARLDAAFSGQRLFVANASHELRTPLTRIRTKLDVTLADPDVSPERLEEMATVIRDAVDQSSALIDALLTLASAHGEIDGETVALDNIVRGVLTEFGASAAGRNLTVTANVSHASIKGDPVLLEHLVRNLVENAIKHNQDDGRIMVDLEKRGGGAVLSVSNSGDVVDAGSVETLFLPLRRGNTDRLHPGSGGFGLGLAIVKAVVDAHRGSVVARPLPEGGLSIEVALPAAPDDDATDRSAVPTTGTVKVPSGSV